MHTCNLGNPNLTRDAFTWWRVAFRSLPCGLQPSKVLHVYDQRVGWEYR